MNDTSFIALTLPSVVVGVALYVWIALSLAALFRKAGEESWQGWVPILNVIVLLRLGRFSPWLAVLALVPVIGTIALFVVLVMACHRINAAFGCGGGMTVLAAVLFPVWSSVLGWGSARWLGAEPTAGPGPLRRGAPDVDLGERVSTPYASRVSASSVFGAHGPAGGPVVPPRPPAPTGGFPSVVPAPAPPLPEAPAPAPRPRAEPSAAPAFRSTMRGARAQTTEDAVAGFDTRAPFTQTFPVQSDRSHFGPHPPAGPVRAVRGEGRDVDDTAVVSAAAALDGGDSPEGTSVPAVPSRPDAWAPPVASGPSMARRALRLPVPGGAEAHYETSAEVSAVAGAPTSGSPRSARASVSAQHTAPEIPDDDGFDETFVALRRRTAWALVPPLGAPVPLTGDVVIVGRRPTPDGSFPGAQLVPISDETRTVSKTHARLVLEGEGWTVVDLDSTNGVILIGEDGAEHDATPGVAERLTARFLLGDAELELRRENE